MKLPKNGIAREIRHYIGSLFVFLLIIGIVVWLVMFPVLETNKEVVMMLIGTISASDADGDAVIYSINGADTASISINSSSGVLAFTAAPDYETKLLMH